MIRNVTREMLRQPFFVSREMEHILREMVHRKVGTRLGP